MYISFYLGVVPKVMSVALVEMTATLNVVVSINSTTVMQTYWTASKKSFKDIKNLMYVNLSI